MTDRSPKLEIGDAFGAALRNVLDGGEGWHVVERDDGFVEPMPAVPYFSEPAEWDERDREAMDLVSGRVLDVGAGAGRHSVELQRRGSEVVALDVSAGAIAVCTARGVEHTFVGTVPAFVETEPDPFDAIVMMGNNVSLLASEFHSWRMFEAMRLLLVPGGVVVGTCNNPYLTEDPDHLAYQRWNLGRGRMGGRVSMRVRYRTLATDWFDYLLLDPAELRRLAAVARWSVEQTTQPDPGYLVVMRPS